MILKDGTSFDDKWLPHDRDGEVKFALHGVMRLKRIRSISYWRWQACRT